MYFPIIDVLKENFIEKIPSIVTQWLTDNVNPVGSAVVVDTSLSISGAAADAKVTGDKISDLKSDLSDVYTGGVAEGSVVNNVNTWIAYPIKAGMVYVFENVSTTGSVMAVHTTADTTTNYIDTVGENIMASYPVEFTATADANYICIISTTSGLYKFYQKESFTSVEDYKASNDAVMQNILDSVMVYKPIYNGSFNANGAQRTPISRVRTDLIPFKSGDTFYISNNGARHACGMWENNVASSNLRRNDNSFLTCDEIITPDYDGFLVVIFARLTDTGYYSVSDCPGVVTKRIVETKSYDHIVRSINRIGYGLGYKNSYNGVPLQSLISYTKAFYLGFRIMLCDLQFTSDNVPICYHDLYINQVFETVTDSNGNLIPKEPPIYIADTTIAQLDTYDFGQYMNMAYKGTKVLRFQTMLEFCKNTGCELYIEQKTQTMTTAQYDIVFDLINSYGMIDRCTWAPQTLAQLTAISEYNSVIAKCFHTNLPDSGSMPDSMIDGIVDATNEYNRGRNSISLNKTATITQEQVNKLASEKIGLHITCDNIEEYETFVARGTLYNNVKEVLTNYGFILGKYLYDKGLNVTWKVS